MKKILFLLSVISVIVFAACDYNDRNFDGLEDMTKPVYKPALTYEFVDADYKGLQTAVKNGGGSVDLQNLAKTVGTNRYFTVTESAKDLIPYSLASKYYSVSKGASAKVTYKFFEALPEELSGLSSDIYKLSVADYKTIWGQEGVEYLTDEKAAADVIPAILASSLTDAQKNDAVVVNYNYSMQEPDLTVPVEKVVLKEDFEDYVAKDPITKRGWTTAYPVGTKQWSARTYSGNFCAYFGSGAVTTEAWLIAPEVDLAEVTDPVLSFDYQFVYITEGHQPISVKVSTNYNGTDPTAATWTDITSKFTTLELKEMKDDGATYASAGEADLSAYKGKIRIAFVYSSVNPAQTTARLDNIIVKGYEKAGAKTLKTTAGSQSESLNKLFVFNGTKWNASSVAAVLNPTDYTAMGDPGKNGNFSSSILPEKYLPIYLLQQYPYAQEKDLKTVIYKYYDGKNTVLRASEYRYAGGVWAANDIVDEQYVFNGTKWMFDPSITHTIVKGNGDMQIIVDWVAANKGEKYYQENPKGGYFTNAEYWFGASEYQGNFEMRVDNRRAEDAKRDNLFKGKTDDEVEAMLYAQLKDAFYPLLEKRYPNAQPQQSGADVYYNVIFQVYATGGVRKNYTIKYQCTEVGKFTFVEGPKEIE